MHYVKMSSLTQRELPKDLNRILFVLKKKSKIPIAQHFKLKLYSVVLPKSLIYTFFEHGIVLPCCKILELINEPAQKINDFDNKVLSSILRTGVLTAFVDKNIDKNSLSKDAKTHFHGTAATVLQFQASKNQDQQRLRKKNSEYYYGKKLDNR